MNIEVYTICYNEEFLMPFFLQHYSEHVGASKIVIYDNYSTDKCIEIAQAFTGCTVEVIKYNSNNKIHDGIYMDIKNSAWKKSTADWVIVCDMDELVYFKDKTILNQPDMVVYQCNGYQMVDTHLPIYNPNRPITEQLVYGTYDTYVSKCAVFKPTIKNFEYQPGAHHCHTTSPVINPPSLYLLHYKFMSLEYVIQNYKLRQERLSEFNKKTKLGHHYNWELAKFNEVYARLFGERINVLNFTPKKTVSVCILNYKNNDNAVAQHIIFSKYCDNVFIVDHEATDHGLFTHVEKPYYTAKINTASELMLKTGSDYCFYICSDVKISDASAKAMLVDKIPTLSDEIGVYTPSVDGRCHQWLEPVKDWVGYRPIPFAEGMIFVAKRDIVEKLTPILDNTYGWGVDVYFGYITKQMGYTNVIDDKITVYHPTDIGYDSNDAYNEMVAYTHNKGEDFFKFLSAHISI